jgi:acyl carrier protein
MSTFDTIHQLAAEKLRLPAERLLRATTLNEAGVDSLAAVDLIFAIETRFAIAINPEDVAGVQSLRDLAVLVDRIITRKAHSHDE